MEPALDIVRYLDRQGRNMLRMLEHLAVLESPSDHPESQAPIFRVFQETLSAIGYQSFLYPGKRTGGFLYARPQHRNRGRPVQLMVGHCDTVWPIGTLTDMPVAQEDGRLKGPGVYDMKAGLTQMVFALKTIHDLDLTTEVDPVVLINADEEIGSPESTPAIRRLARIADRAFILEPSLGHTGKLKTARKGGGRFTIDIQGKSAHAGLDPTQGVSAIVALAQIIQTLNELNDPASGISVNVGMIEGGIRPNVIAPTSRAVVDVRVPTAADALRIEQVIQNLQPPIPEVTVQVAGRITRFPMEKTSRNRKLWKLAHEAALKLDLNIQAGTAGGSSDGNTTSLYTASLDGLGAVGDGAHARHEFVDTAHLVDRTALLVLLLLAPPLGRGDKKGRRFN